MYQNQSHCRAQCLVVAYSITTLALSCFNFPILIRHTTSFISAIQHSDASNFNGKWRTEKLKVGSLCPQCYWSRLATVRDAIIKCNYDRIK